MAKETGATGHKAHMGKAGAEGPQPVRARQGSRSLRSGDSRLRVEGPSQNKPDQSTGAKAQTRI